MNLAVGDRVRVSAGALALGAPQTARDFRGLVEGIEAVEEWDVRTVERIKVRGRWWPVQMWEKDQ